MVTRRRSRAVKRAPARRSYSAGRVRRAPARRRAAPARARRAPSRGGQTVRLVIEHQGANAVQRPEMSGMVVTRNTKRARF